MMALQLSTVYFFSGAQKLDAGFLSGERLQAIFMWQYWGSYAPDFPGFHELMLTIAVLPHFP